MTSSLLALFGWGIMTAIPVPGHWVLAVMNRLQPSAPHTWLETYQETSEAIADAANAAPLFEGADGPMRTASVLLAIAFYESKFYPNAVDRDGHAYGIFQIEAKTVPELTANVLLVPREAAPVALNLIRTSLKICGKFPWSERLGWYAAGGNGCKEGGRKVSRSRMFLSNKIMHDYPDEDLPLLPPMIVK